MDIDRWAKSTASEKGGIGMGGIGKQQKQASKIIINKFIYWTYSEVELNQASKIIIIYLLDVQRLRRSVQRGGIDPVVESEREGLTPIGSR